MPPLVTPESPGHVPRVALALWLATLVGAVSIAVVAVAAYELTVIAFLAFDAVAFTSVGALIVRRQPDNRVGWLLAGVGPALVATFSGFLIGAIRYEEAGPRDDAAMVFGWLGANLFTPTFLLFALVGLVFPDGRLPSPRWRPAVAATIAVIAVCGVVVAIRPGPIEEGLGDNPLGVEHPVVAGLAAIATPLLTLATLAAVVLGAVAVAIRVRGSSGIVRQQAKWFVTALVVFAILLPMSFADEAFFPATDAFTPFDILAFASLALIPLSVGVAVLRYRLYAIDRIVSRTLGWGVVSAVLVGAFAVLVLGLQAALSGLTGASTVAVAASTLIVAASFQPVRRWGQGLVDRRFDRSHYDAARVIDGFSGRLRHQLDLAALTSEVREVATATVRPRDAAVWLRGTRRPPA